MDKQSVFQTDERPESLLRTLEQMEQEGVGFYLNGKKTAPREIIRTCCMREKAVYMPDFVMDEEGKLCEVRYDEVTKW